ncbi:hypothetical protein ATSB10_33200 [Dyella thiooxydans]|uniref:Uncharacterized protein n=1 Tax=Dyella thiooxydans TaxID=445710 RepID=A0A160N4V3_9GAMM|nr:hypothetical protein ATSB10_33200 [Dyella thiooxydans]
MFETRVVQARGGVLSQGCLPLSIRQLERWETAKPAAHAPQAIDKTCPPTVRTNDAPRQRHLGV